MRRRKFIQTGVGAAFLGAISFKQLWAQPERQAGVKKHSADSSTDELQKIVRRYGGEFGQLKTEIKEG